MASLKLSKRREGPERPASRSWKLPWRMREAAGITMLRARASAASLTQGSAVGEFSRPSSPARLSQAPSKITPSGLARPRKFPSPSSRQGVLRLSRVARPLQPRKLTPLQLLGPLGCRTPSQTLPLYAPRTPRVLRAPSNLAPPGSRAPSQVSRPLKRTWVPHVRQPAPTCPSRCAPALGPTESAGPLSSAPGPRLTSPGPDCRRARPSSCPLWRT